MDAMSHLGVARDVSAYLSYHSKTDVSLKSPYKEHSVIDKNDSPIQVIVENKTGCQRYSGISIDGVTVKESPTWLSEKLKAIGVRPINNIVDVTNFILHETGQPLHAFNANAIRGKKVIVKNLPENTPFISLDGKERKLSSEDLMICDAEGPMCIAGVFGGLESGVKDTTTNIFLESAWFNPVDIRRTSFRHGLRTDAALRFEKTIDISNTVNALKRAAALITTIAGGTISSQITDLYPAPKEKSEISFSLAYLKKLSGKMYQKEEVKSILVLLVLYDSA
jgi:phenylalanyl-tRNA synthetase beta chain